MSTLRPYSGSIRRHCFSEGERRCFAPSRGLRLTISRTIAARTCALLLTGQLRRRKACSERSNARRRHARRSRRRHPPDASRSRSCWPATRVFACGSRRPHRTGRTAERRCRPRRHLSSYRAGAGEARYLLIDESLACARQLRESLAETHVRHLYSATSSGPVRRVTCPPRAGTASTPRIAARRCDPAARTAILHRGQLHRLRPLRRNCPYG